MNQKNPSHKLIAATVLLATAVFAVLFYRAGAHVLFNPDEGRYVEIAREMLMSRQWIIPHLNGLVFLDKPILYYWLQASALWCFGLTEWTARFWPILFGGAGIVVTFLAANTRHDRVTAWLAALILLTSPLYFFLSRYADMNMMVAVLIAGSLFCFLPTLLKPYERVRTRLPLLGYVLMALAFLTKGLIGIAFPAIVIALWILFTRQWRLLSRLSLHWGILIILAITLPWMILAQTHNPHFLHYFFVVQQFQRYLQTNFNSRHGLWFYPAMIVLGLFPWGILLISAAVDAIRNRKHLLPSDTLLWLWLISITVFFSIPASKIAGYILPVYFPAAILIARYAESRLAISTLSWLDKCLFIGLCVGVGLFLYAYSEGVIDYAQIASHGDMPSAAVLQSISHSLVWILSGFGTLLLIALVTNRFSVALLAMSFQAIAMLWLLSHSTTDIARVQSAKPIAAKIAPYLNPDTRVIVYLDYEQDLPFYLNRTVQYVAPLSGHNLKTMRDNTLRQFLWSQKLTPAAEQTTPLTLIDENAFFENPQKNALKNSVILTHEVDVQDLMTKLSVPATVLGCTGSYCAIKIAHPTEMPALMSRHNPA